MATTAEDYARFAVEAVTLPSGHVFVVKRQVSLWDFYTGEDLAIPSSDLSPSGVLTPDMATRMQNVAKRALVQCVVSPKVTADYTPEGVPIPQPGCLHIETLLLVREDFNWLLNHLADKAGLRREVAVEAESFRPDEIGPTPESPGGDVSRPAQHLDASDSSRALLQRPGDVAPPGPGDRPSDDEATPAG